MFVLEEIVFQYLFFFAAVLRDYQTAMSWTAIFILGLFVFSSVLANERE